MEALVRLFRFLITLLTQSGWFWIGLSNLKIGNPGESGTRCSFEDGERQPECTAIKHESDTDTDRGT